MFIYFPLCIRYISKWSRLHIVVVFNIFFSLKQMIPPIHTVSHYRKGDLSYFYFTFLFSLNESFSMQTPSLPSYLHCLPHSYRWCFQIHSHLHCNNKVSWDWLHGVVMKKGKKKKHSVITCIHLSFETMTVEIWFVQLTCFIYICVDWSVMVVEDNGLKTFYIRTELKLDRARKTSSWSIKVSIAAQKFATSCITDLQGSDTTWELRMGKPLDNLLSTNLHHHPRPHSPYLTRCWLKCFVWRRIVW